MPTLGEKPRNLSNMRGSRKVTMVTVLEGKGTEELPYEERHYVIDEDGKTIGKLEREYMFLN